MSNRSFYGANIFLELKQICFFIFYICLCAMETSWSSSNFHTKSQRLLEILFSLSSVLIHPRSNVVAPH